MSMIDFVGGNKEYSIHGVSYIGNPKSNTAMYITKKIESKIHALKGVKNCLVFLESGIKVPEDIVRDHNFVFSSTPQLEYTRFVTKLAEDKRNRDNKTPYNRSPQGYYISKDAIIGANALIEPNVFIGPGVIIGDNAVILNGSVIKNSIIGNGFIANENATIGTNGFTMTEDENNNKIRIPTLGRVVIGNNVEIGAHDNVCCGSGGDTVIGDNAKISAFVNIGHDSYIDNNVEITAGCILGGFTNIGENTFLGLNCTIKNRVSIGRNVVIGMGANVITSFGDNLTVAGNPARVIKEGKIEKEQNY